MITNTQPLKTWKVLAWLAAGTICLMSVADASTKSKNYSAFYAGWGLAACGCLFGYQVGKVSRD